MNNSKQRNRVVITGLGVVSPAGCKVEDFWSAIINGHSFVKRVSRFDASEFDSQIAAEIDNFDPDDTLDPEIKGSTYNFSQYGLFAAIDAVNDAGLTCQELNKGRCGVILGTASGGISFVAEQILTYKDYAKIAPHTLFSLFPFSCPALIARHFKLSHASLATATACSSSSDAIGLAFRRISRGESDIIITGGADSNIEPLTYHSLSVLNILSKRKDDPERAFRPFDLERDGFALGEGAAVLVLENYEHAKARGVEICAEVLGYGSSLDGYHITAREPSGEQARKAGQAALDDSRLTYKDIQYVSAHGTATKMNDAVETSYVKNLFKDHAYNLMMSSIKPVIGHWLGAAPATQAVANALIFKHNKIPPTINYNTPDPICDLNCVPNVAEDKVIDYILQNSAGFAGINSILVLGRVN